MKFKAKDFEGLALHYDPDAKAAVAADIANKLVRAGVSRERYRQMKLKNTRLWEENQRLRAGLDKLRQIIEEMGGE